MYLPYWIYNKSCDKECHAKDDEEEVTQALTLGIVCHFGRLFKTHTQKQRAEIKHYNTFCSVSQHTSDKKKLPKTEVGSSSSPLFRDPTGDKQKVWQTINILWGKTKAAQLPMAVVSYSLYHNKFLRVPTISSQFLLRVICAFN